MEETYNKALDAWMQLFRQWLTADQPTSELPPDTARGSTPATTTPEAARDYPTATQALAGTAAPSERGTGSPKEPERQTAETTASPATTTATNPTTTTTSAHKEAGHGPVHAETTTVVTTSGDTTKVPQVTATVSATPSGNEALPAEGEPPVTREEENK